MKNLTFILMSVLLLGCEFNPDQAIIDIGAGENPVIETPIRIPLYWENTTKKHDERIPWTDHLLKEVQENLTEYDKAKDIEDLCPKYKSLKIENKKKAIGEIWVAISYYESGFKPEVLYRECNKTKCQYSSGCQYHSTYGYCMKGGHKLDGGIVISRGLFQISLQSAQGYGCDVSKPDDLHDPIKNITCANKIMIKQINRSEGKIMASSNYWAVIKPSSSYNKIKEIKSRVLKYAPLCN